VKEGGWGVHERRKQSRECTSDQWRRKEGREWMSEKRRAGSYLIEEKGQRFMCEESRME
jgi:hypothetical protein